MGGSFRAARVAASAAHFFLLLFTFFFLETTRWFRLLLRRHGRRALHCMFFSHNFSELALRWRAVNHHHAWVRDAILFHIDSVIQFYASSAVGNFADERTLSEVVLYEARVPCSHRKSSSRFTSLPSSLTTLNSYRLHEAASIRIIP